MENLNKIESFFILYYIFIDKIREKWLNKSIMKQITRTFNGYWWWPEG